MKKAPSNEFAANPTHRRDFLKNSAIALTAGGVGMALNNWMKGFKTTERNDTKGAISSEVVAPQSASPDCSQLSVLLKRYDIGHKIASANTLEIPTPEGGHFDVIINPGEEAGTLEIMITAPQAVEKIIGHSQARYTTVQQAAAALVNIRAMVREKLESSENARPESIAVKGVYDA